MNTQVWARRRDQGRPRSLSVRLLKGASESAADLHYYTFALILLINIVMYSKFHRNKVINDRS